MKTRKKSAEIRQLLRLEPVNVATETVKTMLNKTSTVWQ